MQGNTIIELEDGKSRTFRTIHHRNVLYRVIQKLIEPEQANRLVGKNLGDWVGALLGCSQ